MQQQKLFFLIIASIFFIFFIKINLFAQTDSSKIKRDTLKTVTIVDYLQRTAGIKLEKELLNSAANASDALQKIPNLTVREYGIGNITTVSLRGMSPEQTQVFWDNVPINSPALGQTDFSIINSIFSENIMASDQSGTITVGDFEETAHRLRKIKFVNTNFTNNNILIESPFSFLLGNVKNKKNKFQYQTSVNANSTIWGGISENNFLYKTYQNSEIKTLNHAKNQNFGLLQNFYLYLGNRADNKLIASVWYQNTARDLPPLRTQTTSRKAQFDENLRFKITWGNTKDANLTIAYLRDNLNYNDSTTNIFSKNTMQRFFADAFFFKKAFESEKSGTWSIGEKITFKQDFAKTDYYTPDKTIQQFIITTKAAWKLNKYEVALDAGTIWNTKDILYKIDADYKASDAWRLGFGRERRVRIPTLNDLYWNDGNTVGNPDLQPEKIDANQLYLRYLHNYKKNNYKVDLKFFYNNSENQIQWQLQKTGGWSPNNIGTMISKGATIDVYFHHLEQDYLYAKSKKLRYTFEGNYTYTDAQIFKDTNNYYAVYAPMHQASAGLFLKYKQWQLASDWQYRGLRYINAASKIGQQDALPSYIIGNASLKYTHSFSKNKSLTAFLRVNNVLNTFYTALENRPTALRYASFGLEMQF